MFIGCPAVVFCPKGRVAQADAENSSRELYRSAFKNWDQRASVRTQPRRTITNRGDSVLFPLEMVPVASHQLVQQLPPATLDILAVKHLQRYLNFTAQLETRVVNRAALGIAHGTVGIDVPPVVRVDAHRLYCDEAYHALFSSDLGLQIADTTGVVQLAETPYFLRRLKSIVAALPGREGALVDLLFVIVSETLITGSLTELARSENLDLGVAAAIRDHASDEGRHHAFFAYFLRVLWGALTPNERTWSAIVVPRLINAFLAPDEDAVRNDLLFAGLGEDAVEQILSETYRTSGAHRQMAASATQTLSYFRTLGAFDTQQSIEELNRYGLDS